MSKNILLVGAGAVGQVYGKYLADAGNQVTYLIKEKYQQELAQGVILYHINQDKKRKKPLRFSNFQTVTSWQSAAEKRWDLIILCISTSALHEGFDFDGLKAVLGDATLLLLQPGPEDRALVEGHVAPAQIVQGMITLVSYHTPMPGEQTAVPGTAYWLPPMTPMPFAGEIMRRTAVIQTFIAAGIGAKSIQDMRDVSLFSNAFFMVFLTALEASDWKFKKLRDNTSMIEQMLQANQEAFEAISATYQVAVPFWSKWVHVWMVKSALRVAPHAVPFDLEAFMQVHFTKVKAQTKLLVNTFIRYADDKGLSSRDLTQLNATT